MKKRLNENASRLAFFAATLALLLFIPAGITHSASLRTFLIAVILILLCGGGILLAIANKGKGATVHYFLYDRRRHRMRPKEELSTESIMDAMDYYLRPFCASVLELWADIPKPLRLQLDAEPQFRALVAYRMLCALGEISAQDALIVFMESNERAVVYLCHALCDGGDKKMADHIHHLKKHADTEGERVAVFFKKNLKSFGERAKAFVEEYFEEFMVEKKRLEK